MTQAGGTPFELHGSFAGFIRTPEGKRRMIVRGEFGESLLKIDRDLRRTLADSLAIGSAVIVSGLELPDTYEKTRRAVLRVQVVDGASFNCAIRVCAKKNCWKQGGRELWQVLATELAACGSHFKLESSGCLDRCDDAPNFDCGPVEFARCRPDGARAFIRAISAPAPSQPKADVPPP